MRTNMTRRGLLAAALAFSTLLTACNDDPAAPTVAGIQIADLMLLAPGPELIFSHRDHWHGAPLVRLSQQGLRLEMHFVDASMAPDDHDPPPMEAWFTLADHPDYSVHAVIQDPTLARWEGDRTVGTLTGLRTGASLITFVIRRGTTTIWEAPPLNFRVVD
jgi:predicted small secreted protein